MLVCWFRAHGMAWHGMALLASIHLDRVVASCIGILSHMITEQGRNSISSDLTSPHLISSHCDRKPSTEKVLSCPACLPVNGAHLFPQPPRFTTTPSYPSPAYAQHSQNPRATSSRLLCTTSLARPPPRLGGVAGPTVAIVGRRSRREDPDLGAEHGRSIAFGRRWKRAPIPCDVVHEVCATYSALLYAPIRVVPCGTWVPTLRVGRARVLCDVVLLREGGGWAIL